MKNLLFCSLLFLGACAPSLKQSAEKDVNEQISFLLQSKKDVILAAFGAQAGSVKVETVSTNHGDAVLVALYVADDKNQPLGVHILVFLCMDGECKFNGLYSKPTLATQQ